MENDIFKMFIIVKHCPIDTDKFQFVTSFCYIDFLQKVGKKSFEILVWTLCRYTYIYYLLYVKQYLFYWN